MIEGDLDPGPDKPAMDDASTSAHIHRAVHDRLAPLPPLSADPLGRMVGVDEYEPAAVDVVVTQ